MVTLFFSSADIERREWRSRDKPYRHNASLKRNEPSQTRAGLAVRLRLAS